MSDVLGHVVEHFRDAALGLTDWETALQFVGAATGAHMIQLSGMESATEQLVINVSAGISVDQMQEYFRARGPDPAFNPRTRGVLSFAPGQCFTDDDVIGDGGRSAWPIYREVFHPTDAYHAGQIRLSTFNGTNLGLTFMRSQSGGAFDRHTRQLIDAAAPGVASAVHAAIALGTGMQRTVVEAVDTVGGVAILLGPDRAVVSLSLAAERLIRTGDAITLRSGRLVATDAIDDQALERAFRLAGLADNLSKKQSQVALRGAGGPVVANLCPLPQRLSGSLTRARALLTIAPPARPDAEMIAKQFGFTAAEREIAALLASGATLQDIAARRRSAIGTVRTQLKALFEKTGTHRQAELILLLRQA